MPSTGRKEAILAALSAAWRQGDLRALDTYLSPDYRRYTRSSPKGLSRDDLKATITSTRLAFPDLTTRIEDFVESDDRVAIRWKSEGTHTGQFLGVPPTRRHITVAGANFARFDGDVIVEEWVTWDARELLRALGVITLGEE